MSLQTQLSSFVLRVAQEFNAAKDRTGNLSALNTVNKSSLVAAINELQALVSVDCHPKLTQGCHRILTRVNGKSV